MSIDIAVPSFVREGRAFGEEVRMSLRINKKPAGEYSARATKRLVNAIYKRNMAAVEKALENGASPYARLDNGSTIMRAGIDAFEDIGSAETEKFIDLCIDHGFDPNREDGLLAFSLDRGCRCQLAKKFLDAGADPNRQDGDITPLMHLLYHGYGETAIEGLDIARPDMRPDKHGCNPLHWAIQNEMGLKLVRRLVEAGADINMKADYFARKGTPLHWAVDSSYESNDEVVEYLAALPGIEVDARIGNDGPTPLMLASMKGSIRRARALLKAGADVSAADHDGKTALIYAVRAGAKDVAAALLEYEADINAADADGCTPLMYALRGKSPDLVRFLLERGADPALKTAEGKTARDFIKDEETREVYDMYTKGGGRFTKISDTTIETQDGAGCAIQFNFWTRQVIYRDSQHPDRPVTLCRFSDIERPETLREAFNALKKLGGTPPEYEGVIDKPAGKVLSLPPAAAGGTPA